jgi:zinc ABC transporter, zinc-binding protein adcA
MKKAIKIALAAVVLCGVVFGSIKLLELTKKKEVTKKYSVISTSFPGYDFARAVAGNNTDINVKMLLKPGAESHTFEPTPQDILAIKNSNLFVYVGGDSDEWVKKIISEIDPKKTKVMKLVDLVKTKNEELVEGMEDDDHDEHDHEDEHKGHDHDHDHNHDHNHDHDHDHEHGEHKHEHKDDDEAEVDEHVWTSLKNAKVITEKIMKEMITFDREDEAKLTENGKSYMAKIEETDKKIADMVKVAKRKEIIVADRFPLRYFVDDYGIKYYAAFPGCSDQTEANTKTVSFIVKKVKEDKIPAVFKIELSNGLIAETVAKETGAKILEFQSAHNISERDFGFGVTYVDLMERNFEVLKQALND